MARLKEGQKVWFWNDKTYKLERGQISTFYINSRPRVYDYGNVMVASLKKEKGYPTWHKEVAASFVARTEDELPIIKKRAAVYLRKLQEQFRMDADKFLVEAKNLDDFIAKLEWE